MAAQLKESWKIFPNKSDQKLCCLGLLLQSF